MDTSLFVKTNEIIETINGKIDKMDKVKQAIVYGSPHEALISGFVTSGDILNYLLYTDISFKCMIAYRAVCQFNAGQIIQDNINPDYNGKSFITLTTHDEYVGIYNLSVGNYSVFPGQSEKEKIEIAKRCHGVWPTLYTVNSFSRAIALICDFTDNMMIKSAEKWMIVGARSVKIISSNFSKILANFDIWIDNDYLEPLEHLKYQTYEKSLLARCELLKELASLYWNEVAIHLYRPIVTQNVNPDTPRLDRTEIKRYYGLFPGLFSEELVNMSDLSYNLNQFPETIRAYLLGYPIHQYVPNKETLDKTIKMVDEIGIDQYSDIIKVKNKK